MKAVLATIIIIHHGKYPQFAGVWYQGMNSDSSQSAQIIIDPRIAGNNPSTRNIKAPFYRNINIPEQLPPDPWGSFYFTHLKTYFTT